MSDPQSTLKQLEKETWTALCKSGSDLLPYLAPGCKMLFPGASFRHYIPFTFQKAIASNVTILMYNLINNAHFEI